MTLERYLDKERFTYKEGDRFIYKHAPHPTMYQLIDKVKEQKYTLSIKETKKDFFFYADEIIKQADNRFIVYREGYRHYRIRDTQTGLNYEIPKKQTCKDICFLLNDLAN